MLPLALASQLSTSGINKAVPSVLCKLIWSFVMEHNTAKIIKAALFAHRLTPDSDNATRRSRFAFRMFVHYAHHPPFHPSETLEKKFLENERRMKKFLEKGERQAPPRPSGKCIANPICIQ